MTAGRFRPPPQSPSKFRKLRQCRAALTAKQPLFALCRPHRFFEFSRDDQHFRQCPVGVPLHLRFALKFAVLAELLPARYNGQDRACRAPLATPDRLFLRQNFLMAGSRKSVIVGKKPLHLSGTLENRSERRNVTEGKSVAERRVEQGGYGTSHLSDAGRQQEYCQSRLLSDSGRQVATTPDDKIAMHGGPGGRFSGMQLDGVVPGSQSSV